MPEISDLRARHRRLIADIAALLADFELETGLRVQRASTTRDEHELAKLLGSGITQAEGDLLTSDPKSHHRVWIVPHAEV